MRISTLFGAAMLAGLASLSVPAVAQPAPDMAPAGGNMEASDMAAPGRPMMRHRMGRMGHQKMMMHHRGRMMHHRKMMRHHGMMHRKSMRTM